MSTKPRAVTLISFLLLCALVRSAIPVTKAQQQPQRERRVAAPGKTATPRLTPTPTPSPVPTVIPAASPVETPEASPQATPSPTVVALKTAATTRTLAELQARISDVLAKPALAPAMVGIKVSSLET